MPVPFSGCWVFTGSWTTGNGYGKTRWEGHDRVLHRVVWEILVGPICPTFQLDHKCRVRCCCNPGHLDPVTPGVNTHRGEATLFKRREDYEVSFVDVPQAIARGPCDGDDGVTPVVIAAALLDPGPVDVGGDGGGDAG